MSRWARHQQRLARAEEAAERSGVEAGRFDQGLLRWVSTAELRELEAMLSGPLEENCHPCGSSTCGSRRRVERAEPLLAAEAARAAEIVAAAKERRAAAPPSNRHDDGRTDA